jgi:hypothetical protein
MPYTSIYHPGEQMLEVRLYGDFTLREIKETLTDFTVILKEKECKRILTDYREANLKLSVTGVFRMPEIVAEIFTDTGINLYQLRRALVTTKFLKDFKFFETVSINRGQYARVFDNVDEARSWLLEE